MGSIGEKRGSAGRAAGIYIYIRPLHWVMGLENGLTHARHTAMYGQFTVRACTRTLKYVHALLGNSQQGLMISAELLAMYDWDESGRVDAGASGLKTNLLQGEDVIYYGPPACELDRAPNGQLYYQILSRNQLLTLNPANMHQTTVTHDAAATASPNPAPLPRQNLTQPTHLTRQTSPTSHPSPPT